MMGTVLLFFSNEETKPRTAMYCPNSAADLSFKSKSLEF